MKSGSQTVKLLNLGCGNRFLPEWTNVDFHSMDPGVMAHDLRHPLPFPDNSFDAIYHSHFLEHLTIADAKNFLQETFRVLRQGGITRVVVPDLEQLCRQYLESLEKALIAPDCENSVDIHEWSIIELIDQMVRDRSGGLMGTFIRSGRIPDHIQSRIGDVWQQAQTKRPLKGKASSKMSVWHMIRSKFDYKLMRLGMRITGITEQERSWVHFRRCGESHLWMYDRASLSRLLLSSGFSSPVAVDAFSGGIQGWNKHCWLDVSDGRPRKKDSLYMEAQKP